MKNTYTANSMGSLKSGGMNESNYFSRSNRSMVPILATDFESRLMLNAQSRYMTQKKSMSQEIRKNDFIVDLNENSNNKTHSILMNCLNHNESDIDIEECRKEFLNNKKIILLSKKNDEKNNSLKSLVSESFKTFNLFDLTEAERIKQKENINYIKPWVESSCKYYSSNSLSKIKRNNLDTLDKNSNLIAQNDFHTNNYHNNPCCSSSSSSNYQNKNNETNDQFIKNIEHDKLKNHHDKSIKNSSKCHSYILL
jgi:hypothetical protein